MKTILQIVVFMVLAGVTFSTTGCQQDTSKVPAETKKTKVSISPAQNTSKVIESPVVLGKWSCVDFVRNMDDFKAGQRFWKGEFFLTELDFQSGHQIWLSFNNNSRMQHSWTQGKVDIDESRPALYTVKEIDGNQYMFFEWISGDVTIRGQKPCYYVLKKKTQ